MSEAFSLILQHAKCIRFRAQWAGEVTLIPDRYRVDRRLGTYVMSTTVHLRCHQSLSVAYPPSPQSKN